MGVSVTSAVTVPDTHTTRPAPLAAIDGDTTACSPVRVSVAPGAVSCPSGSGTNTSAAAGPAAAAEIAAAIAAQTPSRAPRAGRTRTSSLSMCVLLMSIENGCAANSCRIRWSQRMSSGASAGYSAGAIA
ncbi:Uncharacterised protein [Mycobacteroides abscessus subsp. abscessus]|nr:Uncharacterised protein [Mycobacteroides abscessus subsp. abscessus]